MELLETVSQAPAVSHVEPLRILHWYYFKDISNGKALVSSQEGFSLFTVFAQSSCSAGNRHRDTLQRPWEMTDAFCGIWASNNENTQTHSCIPTSVSFLVRRNCLGSSIWISIQKDKQNRTSLTPSREERGNGGRHRYWPTVVLKGNMQKNWNLN